MTPSVPSRPRPNATYVRFRESHHAIARMFASGMTISKVSHETGYTRRRLNILLSDPSFQELIANYTKSLEDKMEEGMDQFFEIHYGNMLMAAHQLADKLAMTEEAGEHLPVRDYLAIVKDGADRFGYGAKSTRVNVNVDFATALDKAIERTSKVIEAHPLRATTPKQSPPLCVVDEPRQIEQQVSLDPGIGSGSTLAAPAQSSLSATRVAPSYSGLLRRGL